MTPFECQGYWWIPGQEANTCPGTLRCDESGKLTLSLLGVLAQPKPGGSGYDAPLVFGEIVGAGDRLARFSRAGEVTLRDCFETKHSFGSTGRSTQEFFAHRAFFGDHLFADGAENVSSVSVSYSGLASWADDLTGFRDGPQPFSMVWDDPKSLTDVPFPGGRLLLGVGCETRGGKRERHWTETVGISLWLETPIAEAALERAIVYPLQNFLTFATDHPNVLTKFQIRSKHNNPGGEWVTVIGPRTFDDESEASNLLRYRMLFTLSEVRDRLQDVLRRWVELSQRLSAAADLYFGLQYRPPEFSDFRFQLTAQVLALYHARLESTSARPPSGVAIGGLPESLRNLLMSHPIITVEQALSDLARRHWEVFEPLVGEGVEKGPESFIRSVVDTLRYVLIREVGPTGPPSGTDYYWRGEQLAFLWKICLLSDLGFSPAEQRNLLEQNAKYKHLRDEVRPRLRFWQ